MTVCAGTRLGSYEILYPIGEGGMGVVYQARDLRLGRSVAIKTLSQACVSDSSLLRRFELEAKALLSINHPNIITLYSLGDSADAYYIVMELVEGQTLRHHISTKRLKLRDVLDVGIQVASALSASHAAGVVHRDIKPENVMVRPDGLIKVLDFGLAKLAQPGIARRVFPPNGTTFNQDTLALDELSAKSFKTLGDSPMDGRAAGAVKHKVFGTASYMSPEYIQGEEVDARTDIFSLGVMLYELIAGVPPFGGKTDLEIIDSVLEDEPPPLTYFRPKLPQGLDHLVVKSIRKERDLRYQGIKDLLIDLQDVKQQHALETSAKRSVQRRVINKPLPGILQDPSREQPVSFKTLFSTNSTAPFLAQVLADLISNGTQATGSTPVEISLVLRIGAVNSVRN